VGLSLVRFPNQGKASSDFRPNTSDLSPPNTPCTLPLVSGDELQPRPRAARRRVRKKANGGASKSNGTHKPDNGDLYLDRRREARDRDDELLLEVMRKNPEGSIGDWATTIHKSRTSCVSALHRLRDAGLAESAEGKWRLVESEAPRAPRWVEPVSALGRREHAGG
jgi:hypothetical protein